MNVENLIKQCRDALPTRLKTRPWTILEHGYNALDSEEKLNAYIAAYGEMHVYKCRKALQNFPFTDFVLQQKGQPIGTRSVEIFDWGCGQGLATLVFLQFLADREILHCVRRINLIEPSPYAIKRAAQWADQASAAHTTVRTFERYVPSNDGATWNDIDARERIVVHLFSNILDVPNIGLKWLADTTSDLGQEKYMVCVSEIRTRYLAHTRFL